ncbi:hypothetical protein NC796_03225 [Aliifodinibius sp. S!AR15-10]|uniref:LuxE/PaaK family acyltransferase n=1 Tax=Aliifodinibius sp. S!AR15-10 TaxID=2950437 RepID=UPI0028658E61|nr:hypothetical protein [Aliifodinibius sp. S!AR15-10]MDR8390137.1 hypothetical protein [Aliifodinibius sp. S!AR15-10]
MTAWKQLIFDEEIDFSKKLEKVYHYQKENNAVYRRFCDALSYEFDPDNKPPLLPIQAFKDAVVTCKPRQKPDLVFQSSGTSGMERSRHLVADEELYQESLRRGFEQFYDLGNAVIWAYTPGYSENPDSSLLWMLHELIKEDASGSSHFLPLDEPLDKEDIKKVTDQGKQLFLFGAAFGLLDLLEMESPELPGNSIVIETGGMKTHRRELEKEELHRRLAEGFGLHPNRIHSEYGMCELLSQAYATGGQWFQTPPWMEVSVWNPENPLSEMPPFQEGLIGITDLANVHSCSFVLTGDRGVRHKDGRFKVLGRWNPKDLRGCNFLIDED